jgi:hypothetical protein
MPFAGKKNLLKKQKNFLLPLWTGLKKLFTKVMNKKSGAKGYK